MVFTNSGAALCLVGIFLRIWESAISSMMLSKYINVYQTTKEQGGDFTPE
jgi:hypothetical protein